MTRRLFVVAAVLLAFAGFSRMYSFQVRVPLRNPFSAFPLSLGGWEGRKVFFTTEIEQNLGVQEYMQRYYRKGDRAVDFYVGYYGLQKAGEQIHSPKHCLPGAGLDRVSETVREREVPGYGRVRFLEAIYRRGDERQVFYYWYRMMDEHITNEYLLKAVMVWNSLVHRRNEATFVRLATRVLPGERVEDAEAALDGFMEDVLPFLSEYLPK